MSKYTPWFNGKWIKPRMPGVYETCATRALGGCWQHWNGEFWGAYECTPQRAHRWAYMESSVQAPVWRGLAKKP